MKALSNGHSGALHLGKKCPKPSGLGSRPPKSSKFFPKKFPKPSRQGSRPPKINQIPPKKVPQTIRASVETLPPLKGNAQIGPSWIWVGLSLSEMVLSLIITSWGHGCIYCCIHLSQLLSLSYVLILIKKVKGHICLKTLSSSRAVGWNGCFANIVCSLILLNSWPLSYLSFELLNSSFLWSN